MGESAIAAPDREMTTADSQVMRSGDMTVPAGRGLNELPEIITADFRKRSFSADILDTGDKHTGCSAVITRNLSLIGDRFDNLIGNFPAMVTIGAVPRKNEAIAHGR